MQLCRPFPIVLAVALIAGCGTAPVKQTEIPQSPPAPKTRASTPPPEDPHWSYEQSEGPARWGKLSAKWAACGTGRAQSPIDIEKTQRANLPTMKTEFRPAELKIVHHEHMADVVNTGHTVQVNYTQGDKLRIGDEEYELLQYHFHSPSEHTVGGKRVPLEMHLVHKSAQGGLAVIGVFLEEGETNPAFEPIWANLPRTKGMEYHLQHVNVDVNQLLPRTTASYRYSGSLTTPPCSEDVKWIVLRSPVPISRDQIDRIRSVLAGNNRPTQALNGRAVVTDVIEER
jgi:carbonic anhydrase